MCLRTRVNHRDDDTTAICEGYHSFAKSLLRGSGGEALRIDKLSRFLFETVDEMYAYRKVRLRHGARSGHSQHLQPRTTSGPMSHVAMRCTAW